MILEKTLLKFKCVVHNKKPILRNETYFIDGKSACRETFLIRNSDKTGYIVGHDDFLEKFEDIPDLHFKYERHEFKDFGEAMNFLIATYNIELE